jgi:hypothetical protein
MSNCKNRVAYTVPSGWDYKTLDYACGNTGLDGEAVMCEICENKILKGKMDRPGFCKHGIRISEYDCDCWRCETGEN